MQYFWHTNDANCKVNYLFSRIVCIFPYIIRTNWKRDKKMFFCGKKVVKGTILKI